VSGPSPDPDLKQTKDKPKADHTHTRCTCSSPSHNYRPGPNPNPGLHRAERFRHPRCTLATDQAENVAKRVRKERCSVGNGAPTDRTKSRLSARRVRNTNAKATHRRTISRGPRPRKEVPRHRRRNRKKGRQKSEEREEKKFSSPRGSSPPHSVRFREGLK
jgi:hypothetical protein